MRDDKKRAYFLVTAPDDTRIDAHPLVNTATVQLAARDVAALVAEHGNDVVWCDCDDGLL